MEINVVDNPTNSRYEAVSDGVVLGWADYTRQDGAIVFTHVEVDPAYGGQGVGGTLAKGALDDVRDSTRLRVVAKCPFMASYILRHPEYAQLLESR